MVPYVPEELRTWGGGAGLARAFLSVLSSEPVVCMAGLLSTVLCNCQSPKAKGVV